MLLCALDQAGITTTLNSRCSVLAAANGVYGRWDDTKGAENIDFMPTILSRFDMIFVVRDEHDMNRDMVSYSLSFCSSLCKLLDSYFYPSSFLNLFGVCLLAWTTDLAAQMPAFPTQCEFNSHES